VIIFDIQLCFLVFKVPLGPTPARGANSPCLVHKAVLYHVLSQRTFFAHFLFLVPLEPAPARGTNSPCLVRIAAPDASSDKSGSQYIAHIKLTIWSNFENVFCDIAASVLSQHTM
jgi:hypothetical protein